jgi:hypothetical protein
MDFWNALPAVVLPALMFYFLFWIPYRRVRIAKSWRKTPCVIVSSAVEEDAGDSGLYYIVMTYEYDYAGHRYLSDRYSFSFASTAGRWGKRRIVRRLAPGSRAFCYVNPDNPGDAVINRGLTWDTVLIGAFAIVVFGAFLFVAFST